MAATVEIHEHNTATPGTRTNKTTGTGSAIRFKNADNTTPDTNNPLVKVSGGTDRSYEKWLRLRITTWPESATGSISNLQFYTSGSMGTGITVYARTTNPGTYSTPAERTDDTSCTDVSTYTSGSRKNMNAVNAGPFTAVTNTDIGDFLVLHATVDGNTVTAPQNTTTTLTLNFSYDEV